MDASARRYSPPKSPLSPPLPIDEEPFINIYPNLSLKSVALLDKLSSPTKMISIGIVGRTRASVYRYANRVIGQCIFSSYEDRHEESIDLFFDEATHVMYVIAVTSDYAHEDSTEKKTRQHLYEWMLDQDVRRSFVELFMLCHCTFILWILEGPAAILPLYRHMNTLQRLKATYLSDMVNPTICRGKKYSKVWNTQQLRVPMIQFVLRCPAGVQSQLRQHPQSQKMIATYRKTMESKLNVILKSLRYDGVVGKIGIGQTRFREIHGKDDGGTGNPLFKVDAQHSLVLMSQEEGSSDGSVENRLAGLLYQQMNGTINDDTLGTDDDEEEVNEDKDEMGTSAGIQLISKFQRLFHFTTANHSTKTPLSSSSFPSCPKPTTIGQWVQTLLMYHKLVWPTTEAEAVEETPPCSSVVSHLSEQYINLMDTIGIFAQHQCQNEISAAISVYQHELPRVYNSRKHQHHLARAIQVFQARVGSHNVKYSSSLEQIQNTCTIDIWQNQNRRSCDETS